MAGRKVYIVDDEEAIRRSAALLLNISGFEATTFDSGAALLNVAGALMPGCILLDIRMPDMDGVEVQRALAARGSVHPVVIMTGHGDVQAAIAAFTAGAVAFVEKPFSRRQLLETLGFALLKLDDPAAYRDRLEDAAVRVDRLAPDERAVLEGLTNGRSNDEIAVELGLASEQIELRRARIFEQLEVESPIEALGAAFAARLARN